MDACIDLSKYANDKGGLILLCLQEAIRLQAQGVSTAVFSTAVGSDAKVIKRVIEELKAVS